MDDVAVYEYYCYRLPAEYPSTAGHVQLFYRPPTLFGEALFLFNGLCDEAPLLFIYFVLLLVLVGYYLSKFNRSVIIYGLR